MKRYAKLLAPIAVIAGGVVVAFLVVAGRPRTAPSDTKPPAPLVRAMAAEPSSLGLSVRAHGTVAPRTEIDIVAEVSGRAVSVSPDLVAGGFVSEGDILVQIDDRDYALAVSTAEADVAQAQVSLVREEAEAEVAIREWGKLRGGTPPPLVARKPQLAEARARVEAAQAALERAELDLARTTIRASFDGRVREESIDAGQFVERGKPVARVYSIDVAEIRLPIPNEQLAYLDLPLGRALSDDSELAPSVNVIADFAGQRTEWPGRIVRTEAEVDAETRMVHAIAVVQDPYDREGGRGGPPLSVGMFVEAHVSGRRLEDVVVIPRIALRGPNRVLIADGDKLRYRDIEVARTERERVVVSSGIAAGELVCISPIDAAVDGMAVRVADAAPVTGGESQ